ncbi:hypothetical protein HAHI6034_11000 [Hathewaya histolytica]|uniref:Uncharacterized protein n=1 Tax=Hathewaya histolytica TaxID=1498 RepID=A0A4U9RAQ1_HATHI|nr:hypothetical protein [Hathewaya histolytica]VTQ88589.1 Uncharacterised protein [Hathewaya histolytica]
MVDKQTPIEKIRNYYEISKYLNDTQKIKLKDMLGITNDDESRINGLENETEFLMMIYLLGWAEKITSIDESASPLTGAKTSDFLVETINGKKLAIEVKSSKKYQIKFSKKLVLEKKNFSENYNCEAYFAIKLAGHWMLFSNQYIIEHNFKISLTKDFVNSELNDILGERIFLFPRGLEILSIYSKKKIGIGIQHPHYGNLIKIQIKIFGKKVYTVTTQNKEYLFLSYVLENVQDVMSNQEQEIKSLDSDRTLILEKFNQDFSLLKLSCFLMAPIKHMIDNDSGTPYTFELFKEKMKGKDKTFINRNLVLNSLDLLDKEGYPITMFLNKEGYRLGDLKIK